MKTTERPKRFQKFKGSDTITYFYPNESAAIYYSRAT